MGLGLIVNMNDLLATLNKMAGTCGTWRLEPCGGASLPSKVSSEVPSCGATTTTQLNCANRRLPSIAIETANC